MTPAEADVLDSLLTFDFPGVEALRIQAGSLLVTRSCPCGCGSLDLHPQGEDIPTAPSGVVEISGDVFDDTHTCVGGIILFVQGGLPSSLEIYSYGSPLALPAADKTRGLIADVIAHHSRRLLSVCAHNMQLTQPSTSVPSRAI